MTEDDEAEDPPVVREFTWARHLLVYLNFAESLASAAAGFFSDLYDDVVDIHNNKAEAKRFGREAGRALEEITKEP